MYSGKKKSCRMNMEQCISNDFFETRYPISNGDWEHTSEGHLPGSKALFWLS